MYQGKKQFMREHALQQASLVWGLEDLDTVAYVYMGVFSNLKKGKMQLPEETLEKIEELMEEAKQHDGFVQVPTPEQLGLPIPEHVLRRREREAAGLPPKDDHTALMEDVFSPENTS